jgi:acyl-CoA synthetase (AMP-forming)/AMP-acid ligase II/thioesterase domain-containing protein/acyl carrier protein
LTPTEETVAAVWAAELRLPRVGLDDDFIDLGSHSLQGLAIAARLKAIFDIAIPVRILFEEPTVADLAAWIDRQRGPERPVAEHVRLQDGAERHPLFAIPGGRGDTPQLYALAKLARQTDPARPLFAFPGDPPVPATTPPAAWVPAAAAVLNDALRDLWHDGPYLLLGYCLGGLIAWEMACQLEAAGETAHLFLVDTRRPDVQIGEGTFRQAVAEALTPAERRARHRRRRASRQGVTTPPDILPPVEPGVRRGVLTRAYRPGPFGGQVTLLVNRDWHRVSPTLGWEELAGDGLRVAVTARGHGLHWHIPEVADHLRTWLDRVDPADREAAAPTAPESAVETAPETIVDALVHWAARTPHAPALITADGQTFDYARLAGAVNRLADDLRRAGIRRDDAVVLVLPDGPELLLTLLAAMSVGIAVPLAWGMTRHEYASRLFPGLARAVVLPADADSPAREIAAEAGLPVIEARSAPDGGVTLASVAEAAGPEVAPSRPRPEDVALVISSSGTTGQPKRIPRTHANIATTSADVVRSMQTTVGERCLPLTPIAYSQGISACLSTLWAGGAVLVLPEFDLARLPERVAAFRPTWFSATPSVLRAIASDAAASAAVRAAPPRMIRASSGFISAAELAALETAFGAPMLHSYGMSEASFISGEPFGAAHRKPGSVGLPNHEVRVVAASGDALPVGETGEIVVRGPNVFPGYLDDAAANAAAFLPGGWLRTGDAGHLDGDGFLHVTGRLKDLIKRAGLNVSPHEIETALLTHPAVAEACVFSVPHPELGEDVAAAVVMRPGALATERALREHAAVLLSPAKVPRAIAFVAAIPRGPTGKPLRRELAAAFLADSAPVGAASRAASDDLDRRVAALWASVLARQAIAVDADLLDLAVDSLQVARIAAAMEREFAVATPPRVLFEARTPARVAAWIAATTASAAARQTSPLFVITVPGSGADALRPARLARAAATDRRFLDLAVRLPADEATAGDDALGRATGACLESIRAEQASGPYLLTGIGAGGAIAAAVATHLERGGEMARLLLIDAHCPAPMASGCAGSATLIADRRLLARDATLGWGAVFGERLRVVPIEPAPRPRLVVAAVARALTAWLDEVDPAPV